jgi:hypothetical protein
LDFNESLIDLKLPKHGLLHALIFLPKRQIGVPCMTSFKQEVAQTAIELHCASRRFQTSSIPHFSSTRHTKRMRQEGAAAFDKMLDDIAKDIHSLNLLTDTGTVLGFNDVHAIVLNPRYLNVLSPFNTHENCNYSSSECKESFREITRQIPEHSLELVAIICDNCLAQLTGPGRVWHLFHILRFVTFHV